MSRPGPLTPTTQRVLLLAAAADGRVYREAGAVWLAPVEHRVTAAAAGMAAAGWMATGDEVRPGKTLLALAPLGRVVLSTHGRCGRCGVEHSSHGQDPRAQCQHTADDRDATCPEVDTCPVWDVCPTCWAERSDYSLSSIGTSDD